MPVCAGYRGRTLRLPLTACSTSRTMCASCQGELPCRPNIPAKPDQPQTTVAQTARLQGHQKRNRRGIRLAVLPEILLVMRPENFPEKSWRSVPQARTKAMAHVLMAPVPMLGLPAPLMFAERPGLRVPHCADPNPWLNQNHRKVYASTRPLPPQAIARGAMLTSLFLLAACALTASQNQTRRDACCHVKALWLMGAFCRPRRPLPILCSTSPCR